MSEVVIDVVTRLSLTLQTLAVGKPFGTGPSPWRRDLPLVLTAVFAVAAARTCRAPGAEGFKRRVLRSFCGVIVAVTACTGVSLAGEGTRDVLRAIWDPADQTYAGARLLTTP